MGYRGPKGLWGLFFVVLLLVLFFYQSHKQSQAKSWPVVQGEITGSTFLERRKRSNPGGIHIGNAPAAQTSWEKEYGLHLQYSYQVNGSSYRGNDLGFDATRTSREGIEKLLVSYPSGKAVAIHYNPENPSESMLLE